MVWEKRVDGYYLNGELRIIIRISHEYRNGQWYKKPSKPYLALVSGNPCYHKYLKDAKAFVEKS